LSAPSSFQYETRLTISLAKVFVGGKRMKGRGGEQGVTSQQLGRLSVGKDANFKREV